MTTSRWLCAILSSLSFMTAAQAIPLELDSGWARFTFGRQGSSWGTFDFTLSSDAILKVSDGYLSGDQFDVFNFGTSLGLTSTPTSIGDYIDSNYDAAMQDARWSSASYFLEAGIYSISGISIMSPYRSGAAALRVDSLRYLDNSPSYREVCFCLEGDEPLRITFAPVATVPEPASTALLALGLLGLTVTRRKKRGH